MDFIISDENKKELLNSINMHKKEKGPLMPILHDAQKIFGAIPLEVQKIIAENLNLSLSEVNSVVTFYSHFSITPKGKHVIGVCLGTACYVKESQEILNAFISYLHINPGETTKDNEFTLEATRCLGACGLAPVFTFDGVVYGSATVEKVKEVLKEYIKI